MSLSYQIILQIKISIKKLIHKKRYTKKLFFNFGGNIFEIGLAIVTLRHLLFTKQKIKI